MPPALLSVDVPVRPTADEIAATLPYLPASPNVLPRICRLLHSETATLHELNGLLKLDPGLTARVLQAGNLLAGTHGTLCPSIDEAINYLGTKHITAMIARVAKAQVLAQHVSLYGLDAEEFWRWSVSCALAAELLAEHTGEDPDIAYAVGLLHAVGMFAIDEWAHRKAPGLLFMPRDSLNDFLSSERAVLGCTQAEVGATLLHRWSFPATMVDPIRWQNSPENSAGFPRMACLLSAAKWLRTVVCSEDDFLAPPPPEAQALRPLRLAPEQLSQFVVELRIRLGRARNLVESEAAA
jgi:HD-like signal output (HDOD) protein